MLLKQLSIFISILLLITACSYFKPGYARLSFKLSICPDKEFIIPFQATDGTIDIKLVSLGDFDDGVSYPYLYEAKPANEWIFSRPGPYFMAVYDYKTCSVFAYVAENIHNIHSEEDAKIRVLNTARKQQNRIYDYLKILFNKTTFKVTQANSIEYIGDHKQAEPEFEKYLVQPVKLSNNLPRK